MPYIQITINTVDNDGSAVAFTHYVEIKENEHSYELYQRCLRRLVSTEFKVVDCDDRWTKSCL